MIMATDKKQFQLKQISMLSYVGVYKLVGVFNIWAQ